MRLCIDQNMGKKHVNPSKIWTLMKWSKLVFAMVNVEESCCILTSNVQYSLMIIITRDNMESHHIFIFLKIFKPSVCTNSINFTNSTCGIWVNVKNNYRLITTYLLWKTWMEDGLVFVLLHLSCAPTIFNISLTTTHFNAKKKTWPLSM